VAGRQRPRELLAEVSQLLADSANPADLKEHFEQMLARRREASEPSVSAAQRRAMILRTLRAAPKVVLLLDRFIAQWDRMDSIEFRLHQLEEGKGVTIDINVLPGRQVRLEKVMAAMPALVFRGSSRISILPGRRGAADRVVLFDPVGDGAVELGFEGILYSLVRLLAFPLESGPLREIRGPHGRPPGARRAST